MSKLLLTNQKEWSDELRAVFKKSGFKEFAHKNTDEYLTVYKKLRVDTYNLYQEGEDYAACAGTFIYKEEVGEKALKAVLQDAEDFDLNKLRKNACGSYVVVIKKASKIYVFVDEYHTYYFYYYMEDDKYLFTNTFYHIEKILKQQVDILRLVEYVAQPYNLGKKTPYDKIYKLQGNEYILLDLASQDYNLVRVPWKCNVKKIAYSTLENAAKALKDETIRFAKIRKKLFKKPYLFLTGGVDSRLVLASYMNVRQKPHLVRWHGGNGILNSKVEDYYIARLLAQKLNLPFKNYDAVEDFFERFEQTTEADYDKYGELVCKYGNNEKWHQIYEKLNADFVDYGQCGEIIIGWDKMDAYADFSKPFTLKDFVDKLYVNKEATLSWREYDAYFRIIYDEFYQIAQNADLNCENLSKEDCMWLFFVYGLAQDIHVSNFSNLYFYQALQFLQMSFPEIVQQIPYQFKQKHKLNLLLTSYLYPKLVKYQYYSHCRYRVTDRDKLELREFDNSRKIKFKKSWWHKIMLHTSLKCLKKKQSAIDLENQRIKDFCIEKLKQYSNKSGFVVGGGTFSYLPKYTTFLLADKMNEIVFKTGNLND